jgi:hypothetical protein
MKGKACTIHAHETHAYEVHPYEIHTHEMHTCETPAHEMHTRKMHTREIYAHRSMAFWGYAGAGVVKRCHRTNVFTLASDDDLDSLQRQ